MCIQTPASCQGRRSRLRAAPTGRAVYRPGGAEAPAGPTQRTSSSAGPPPAAAVAAAASILLLPSKQQLPPAKLLLQPRDHGSRRRAAAVMPPASRPKRRPAISRVRGLPSDLGPGRASNQTREGAAAPASGRGLKCGSEERVRQRELDQSHWMREFNHAQRLRPAMKPAARARPRLAHCSEQREGPEPWRPKPPSATRLPESRATASRQRSSPPARRRRTSRHNSIGADTTTR